jgi:hypothetical protein
MRAPEQAAGGRTQVPRRRLYGITKILKRTFWPRFTPRAAFLAAGLRSTIAPPPTLLRTQTRGSAVDAEVCAFVNRGVQPQMPCTLRVLRALQLARLQPRRAQVPVNDERHGLRTNVDIVCTRGESDGAHAVVVELKVGWDVAGSYDAACGRMHGWAAQWPDSHATSTNCSSQ